MRRRGGLEEAVVGGDILVVFDGEGRGWVAVPEGTEPGEVDGRGLEGPIVREVGRFIRLVE